MDSDKPMAQHSASISYIQPVRKTNVDIPEAWNAEGVYHDSAEHGDSVLFEDEYPGFLDPRSRYDLNKGVTMSGTLKKKFLRDPVQQRRVTCMSCSDQG